MRRRHFLLTGSAAGLAAPAVVRAQDVTSSANAAYRLTTLSRDLEQPWSIAFLPDGRLLITERPGRLRVFANGRLEKPPLAGVPKVYARGQAGLLDVCLHPDFARNRVLYLSYIAEGPGGAVTTAARAELADGGLRNVWLANGFEIKKTPFGDAVSFHDSDGLTDIANYIDEVARCSSNNNVREGALTMGT